MNIVMNPKDMISFSREVSAMLIISKPAQEGYLDAHEEWDPGATERHKKKEISAGVLTDEIHLNDNDRIVSLRKVISHVVGITMVPNDYDVIGDVFDMTITVSNGTELRYPFVEEFSLIPTESLSRHTDDPNEPLSNRIDIGTANK